MLSLSRSGRHMDSGGHGVLELVRSCLMHAKRLDADPDDCRCRRVGCESQVSISGNKVVHGSCHRYLICML